MTPEDDGPAMESAELRRALGLIAVAAVSAVLTGLTVIGIGGGLLSGSRSDAAPTRVTLIASAQRWR